MSNISNVTDASFEAEVLQSTTPVLVDFWAPWCAPCKGLAPSLEALAAEYGDKIKVVKVDVDENFETAQKYKVRGVPTLVFVDTGVVKGTKSGGLNKANVQAFIAEHLQ